MRNKRVSACLLFLCFCSVACQKSGPELTTNPFDWVHRQSEPRFGAGVMHVRWTRDLVAQESSRMVPVEYASASFDPQHGMIYVGNGAGRFYAFEHSGREHFRYHSTAGVESAPSVDPDNGNIYFACVDGSVYSLDPDGKLRWQQSVGDPIRQAPLLENGTLYLVTEADSLWAFDKESGEILWRYRGQTIEELTISGHAGLALADSKLITALTNGKVIAVDASDGRLLWELDTSADIDIRGGEVATFFDVDTTPIILDDTVYVASFTGGLYALELESGTLKWRLAELSSLTGLGRWEDHLILSSAERGVALFDPYEREVRWWRAVQRGTPTRVVMGPRAIMLYGESQGGLIAVQASTGKELSRIESGNGFSTAPTVAGGIAVALTNGGRLMSLRLE